MRNKSVVLKLNFILEYLEFPGIGSSSPGLRLKWCIVSVFVCFIITCKQGQVLRDPEWHTPPGGYFGFQVLEMIEGFFGVGKCGNFLGGGLI